MRALPLLLAALLLAPALGGTALDASLADAEEALPDPALDVPLPAPVRYVDFPLLVDEDGDTMTGRLTMNAELFVNTTSRIRFPGGSLTAHPVLAFNGQRVWTEGNDGEGSGLDADLLDGAGSAQFLRTDRSGSIAGDLSVGGTLALGGVPRAGLPAPGQPGRLARVTDEVRGLWMDQGSRWFALNGDVINVKEFGARGDGVADDTAAIRAAAAVANAGWPLGVDTSAPGGNGRESHPTLYFPHGKYLVTGTIQLGEYADVLAERGATLFAADPSVTLLEVFSYRNVIQGLRFAGGKRQLVLAGSPSVDSSLVRVLDCEFSMPGDIAIVLDNRRDPTRGFAMQLVVERFFFEGKRLFQGTADGVVFRDGWLTWKPQQSTDAAWSTAGLLKLEDILGVPDGHRGAVWVSLAGGALFADGVRFGAEDGGHTVVKAATGKDVDRVTRARVTVHNSLVHSGSRYWMLVYDDLPELVDVKNNDGMGESRGIFIDQGVDLTTPRNANQVVIRLHDLATSKPFRQGSNPEVIDAGPEVAWRLRQYLVPQAGSNTLNPLPQANLFYPGAYSPLQGGHGFLTHSASNFAWVADDTSTGYALPVARATGDGALYNFETPLWGAGQPAGDYVFSFFLKAGHSGEVIVYNKGYIIAKIPYYATDTYQQFYAPFHHDGTAGRLGLGFFTWPMGTTLSVGLFAVHRGDAPASYTFPGNPTQARVPEHYYGTAPPAAGTYKAGDIVWSPAPSPGGSVGWVCVAAGSPGIWKRFGTIEA